MPIVLARIDERLIHGQVMSSPALAKFKVNGIIIVDGLLCRNRNMQCILTSSAQSGDCHIGEIHYVPASGLKGLLERHDSEGKRFLAIFKDLSEALEAVRGGCPLPSLNLGNYTSKDPMKKSLTDGFSVGPEESDALNELHSIVGRLYFDGLNSSSSTYRPSKHSWGQR
jgi:mannose/fructose/N-acetylgalactosamine-specific phosphotransferase system component IIB